MLDTNFAADLTIVEEASELIRRITEKDRPLPQFTSCCPGWVHFTEIYAPELLPHLSTAKSPIGMQGPTVKTYFAKQMGLDPRQIVHVTLTPCTAKKFEVRREEMHAAGDYHGIQEMRDTNQVITTRELARWAKAAGIDWTALEDSAYDSLMGKASGAGVIFGNTGGVMEAALRTAYAYLTLVCKKRLLYHYCFHNKHPFRPNHLPASLQQPPRHFPKQRSPDRLLSGRLLRDKYLPFH